MSGVAGLVRFDGRPARPGLDSLAGADPTCATRVWADGPVGLALAPRRASTAALWADDRLAIAADVRIDNRDEVLRAFGPRDQAELAGAPDERLVAAAYLRWGPDAFERFVGAFAVVLYDRGRRRLVLARDAFGVRPLCYALRPGRLVAAASDAAPLAALPGVPDGVDEARVADFLTGIVTDAASTCFEAVRRVPAGHVLVVDEQAAHLRRSYALEARPPIRLGSRGAYAEAFRERFVEAVRCRLSGPATTAAYLSGGLDSSAVACVAAREVGGPLRTLSLVYDELEACDERPYIHAVEAHVPLAPTHWPADAPPTAGEIAAFVRAHGEPVASFGGLAKWALLRAGGLPPVVLDGHGGDEVVSHGAGYVRDLAEGGRWLALLDAVRSVEDEGLHPWTLYWALWRRFGPRPVRRVGGLLGRLGPALPTAGPAGASTWVSRDLADRTGLDDRARAARLATSGPSEQARHRLALTAPLQAHALEVLDRTHAAVGVEARYPFWDRRLVEFCAALPPDQTLHGGAGRAVLRRALRGVLPEAVRRRRGKTRFGDQLHRTLQAADIRGALERSVRSPGLERFVDPRALSEGLEAYYGAATPAPSLAQNLWRTLLLSIWLESPPQRSENPRAFSAPTLQMEHPQCSTSAP